MKDAQKAGEGDAAELMHNQAFHSHSHRMTCEELEAWFASEMKKDPATAEKLNVRRPASSGTCGLL